MMQENQRARPIQARARKTEQRLLDSLERLLVRKPFADVTMSDLAGEADLTTGAIYRRFTDKEDVLRSALRRFIEQNRIAAVFPSQQEISDKELIRWYFEQLADFVAKGDCLLQAAGILHDIDPRTLLRELTGDRLAANIQRSGLPSMALKSRTDLILQLAYEAFRAGRAQTCDEDIHSGGEESLDQVKRGRLSADLTELAMIFLEISEAKSV